MNFKKLIEKRNNKVDKMDELVKKAETETRALTDDEVSAFEELKNAVEQIDKTLALAKESISVIDDSNGNIAGATTSDTADNSESRALAEKRAFAAFIREGKINYTDVETRADVNMDKGTNGAIIPTTIANKIIGTVKNLAPILELSDNYDTKGNLVFPVYDETEQSIKCAYADELKALSATSGKFTAVTLSGFVAGALAKVSKSLINNSDFDVVNYVITKVAEAIAEFLEKEFIVGTDGKVTGLLSSTKVVTAGAATAITADDLINTQLNVPQTYRKNGVWIMNSETFKAIAKLKDQEGNYLLNKDIKEGFGYVLLGRPIYESDSMPTMGTGAKSVIFGDLKGFATKLVKDTVEIQVLQEKYADEHVVGVIGWIEVDAKIIDPQRITILKMA